MEKKCCVEECDCKQYCKGFCKRHYYQFKKYGYIKYIDKIEPTKGCKVEGCDGKHCAKGYCKKHWQQVNKHGKIIEEKIKEIEKKDNYIKIALYNKDGQKTAYTLIDIEDYDLIEGYSLYIDGRGYVKFHKDDNAIALHRYILGLDKNNEMVVDHINRNKLDNRKNNLRICTGEENRRNVGKRDNNTSGYKNISWAKHQNCWVCRVTKNGKVKSKYSKDINVLIEWRDSILKELHGEFACTDDEN